MYVLKVCLFELFGHLALSFNLSSKQETGLYWIWIETNNGAFELLLVFEAGGSSFSSQQKMNLNALQRWGLVVVSLDGDASDQTGEDT